jgi:hypothetical protein
MAGNSPLVCKELSETDLFERSKADLQTLFGLTVAQIDDRLEAFVWALARGGDPSLVQRIATRKNLWVTVIPEGIPPLRIYLRPRPNVPDECELLWIEEKV